MHLVDRAWVVRFPRRAVAVAGLEREVRVLGILARRLPLPVPLAEFIGRPGAGYPWPYWGARLLPGRELADARLPEADRTPLAAGVGDFLRQLHNPALVDLVGELPVDPLRRAEPGCRAGAAADWLDRLVRAKVWAGDERVVRLLDRADGAASPQGKLAVVHGDLHLRHVLVGSDGQASGVIDWGDVCLADPAVDLSIAYAAFSGPARAALLAAYGSPVGADRELAARVLAVFLCAALADYAATEGRPELLAEAVSGLGRAVSEWSG